MNQKQQVLFSLTISLNEIYKVHLVIFLLNPLQALWERIFQDYYEYLLLSLQKDKEKVRLLYGKNLKEFLKNNLFFLLTTYLFLFFMAILAYLVYPNYYLLLFALLVILFILPQNILVVIQFFISSDFEGLKSYLNKKTYLIALGIYQFINMKNHLIIFETLKETEEDPKLRKLYGYIYSNLKQGKDLETILNNLYNLFGESNIGNFMRDLGISSYEGQIKEFLQNYIDSFFYTFDDRLRKYIGTLNSFVSSLLTAFILVNTILVFYQLIFTNLGDAFKMLNIEMPTVDLKTFYIYATFIVPPLIFFLIYQIEKAAKSF
ncbi:MAG: hypothetical protein ABGW69_03800 [Nanoarchaeota archaeon]